MFVSRRGTWLSPSNVRRQWREARTDTGLEWVTPHTFRKTVATLIDKEADTKSAAAQLGHASEEITDTYYIAKPVLAPDVSDILEQLGADRDGPEASDRRSKESCQLAPVPGRNRPGRPDVAQPTSSVEAAQQQRARVADTAGDPTDHRFGTGP